MKTPPPLGSYVRDTLGSTGWSAVGVMFRDSLGAVNPAKFWRVWNPITGWLLRYYVYRPLKRVLPAPIAAVAAFAASGFLFHDLPFGWALFTWYTGHVAPPVATIWFTFIGVSVLLTRELDLGPYSWTFRAAANVGVIALCGFLTLALLSLTLM